MKKLALVQPAMVQGGNKQSITLRPVSRYRVRRDADASTLFAFLAKTGLMR